MKKYCMLVMMVAMQTVHASERSRLFIGDVLVSEECKNEFDGKFEEIFNSSYLGQLRANVLNKLYGLCYKLAGSELDRKTRGLSNQEINLREARIFHQRLTDAMYAEIFQLVDPHL